MEPRMFLESLAESRDLSRVPETNIAPVPSTKGKSEQGIGTDACKQIQEQGRARVEAVQGGRGVLSGDTKESSGDGRKKKHHGNTRWKGVFHPP